MSDNIIFIVIIISLLILLVSLYFILRKIYKNKLLKDINELDIKRNVLMSIPVINELIKIEDLAKSEQLEEKFNNFKERYNYIINVKIAKLTDDLASIDGCLDNYDFDSFSSNYINLKSGFYECEEGINKILEEIKDVTSYEEKYRSIVTKLKARYRLLEKSFDEKEKFFGNYSDVCKLQLENIQKRFSDFDIVMEEKLYNEVLLVVKSLDNMIEHFSIILMELPDILLLINELIKGRMDDLKIEYDKMVEDGYPIEYINIEDNFKVIKFQENDILDRAKVLNINDSLFDLKTILEYLDNMFKDFEIEKSAKRDFDINNNIFINKMNSLDKLLKDIYKELDDIKSLYDLSEKDLDRIENVNLKFSGLVKEYKSLMRIVKKKETSYLITNVDVCNLVNRIFSIEDEIDSALKTLGSMYEDELRAKEQVRDMNIIIDKCVEKVRCSIIPIIHDNYYVELEEAMDAINEVNKQLKIKPIAIKVLNQRVNTARDLVFKFNKTATDMTKYAYFSELLIVYGNRFRNYDKIDLGLKKCEYLYYKGNYEECYDLIIKVLEIINPNIRNDLFTLDK